MCAQWNMIQSKRTKYVIFRKMDETGNHHFKQNNPGLGRKIYLFHMQNLGLKKLT
jgi:hypothetical protein